MVVLVRAALSLRASLNLCSYNRVSLLTNRGVSLRGLRISSHPSVGFRNGRFLGGVTIPQPVILPALRRYATIPTTSSVNDPSPNWSNRPPKETILLDGCDYEHWLIVMDPPEGNPTRDEIIDSYIKTLAQVVGSEEEARMKMYSVSTKHYFAFGCLVSEELSFKIKPLPNVRWVLPDSYLDPRIKSYGGEPFINGQAVPYDPKYHEEWVRNNARCNERRSNDRPRNFDRSRNFERRREMRNNAYQRPPPPPPSPSNMEHPIQSNAQPGSGSNKKGD
ncbi:multiple organellar RNA editing factor 8, chloroplastic/mitochondrial [Cryptomeria japonica]|uniref:multiple organellar RNA editing factor 8, chloroplastic/mitochondrial n=1 Tax=Cryptomeria japonica TaxID=3369 RepID=UPI0027DA8758|nr:multiple organellar RNA editing factor 8, chloroplastic/mitochondrial [Cryptomeria japonica]XP_059067076.1 multiple organellar RNA editing factor 8, chloroplastic/mitochondrial [Cryptomeria japonica]